jgi:hypothetical protein
MELRNAILKTNMQTILLLLHTLYDTISLRFLGTDE